MSNPYFHLIRSAYDFARQWRFRMVYTYGLFAIANSLYLLKPYVFGQFLNVIQTGGDILMPALILITVYNGMDVLSWVFHGPARYLERMTAFDISRHQMEGLFDAVTRLPMQWHADHHSGSTINKIRKSTDALRRFSDDQFMYIETVMRYVGSLVGVAFVAPFIGAATFVASIVIFVVIAAFDRRLIPLYTIGNDLEHRVSSVLYDYIGNIRTVITLRFEALAKSELAHRIAEMLPSRRSEIILNEVKWCSVTVLLVLTTFGAVAGYLVHEVMVGHVLLVGTVVMLYQYLDRLSGAFFSLAWQYHGVIQSDTDLRTVDPILDDFARLVRTADDTIVSDWRKICIHDLCFRYEDAEHVPHSLDHIHIDLARGTRIALVGESGSGKSTLLSLLRGLYDAPSVRVEIDGVAHTSLRPISHLSTLIPQDPEIFENTLAYNISVGLDKTPEELRSAADIARFSTVLDRLPKGLDTHIQEKGVNLSGGERQRLALARGILMARESSIVLLDEPTSSVDPTNELAIYRGIFETFADTCIVSSIHRLHLLPLFDYLYILDHGRVVEHGTLNELVGRTDGVFAQTWERFCTSQSVEGESIA